LLELVVATVQERRDRDAGEDRQPAERLREAYRLIERDHAAERADERLEVDERARELRGHLHLRPCEQPERDQRAGQPEPDRRGDRTARGRRRGRALGDHGHGQRRERCGAELDGGHRAGIAAREQPRLGDDQPRGAGDRREHEQIAGERRAGAAAARDEADAGERDERAGPGACASGAASGPGGDQRHEHGRGADDQRGMADARALDPSVLEQDDPAVADRARRGHRGRKRSAQVTASEDGEDRRGDGEAHHRQPARAEPLEAELGQRHGEPPERAGRCEREDRTPAPSRECGQELRHEHIVGEIRPNSSWI
jgi:hypothetical protein